MKRAITLAALLSTGLLYTASAADQAKTQSDQQMARLVKEIQVQQAAIGENQGKIDAKMATIAEAIRQARIFAGRGK